MPQSVPPFVSLTEVDDGGYFIDALFRRKFGGPPPVAAHHLLAFVRLDDGHLAPACYAHFMPFGDLLLVGGVCTDGEVLRALPANHQQAISDCGGLYYALLRYGFTRFADRCEAFFGYCGDARAETVNLSAGFEKTEHPHLLVNFHRPTHAVMQRALIAKAAAIGPF
jgi:hypothetical protein